MIKPCRLCGTARVADVQYLTYEGEVVTEYKVICDCGHANDANDHRWYQRKGTAVSAWNKVAENW